ncbi:MAG TPA: TonB-dependent receptor, partial [Terriglobia bacterium]|nr:TonB-dependent receptor [Terriglobia bacterium]
RTEDLMKVPPVTVNVFGEAEDAQTLPASVTAVPERVLSAMGAEKVSDAGILAPNTFFSEFTARKLSNARFRGIGSSPANPGVTTFIDGVPQLNSNSSSIELLDIDQIEFVRGAQSAMFGRNTLGGLISIDSKKPSLSNWRGGISVPVGSQSEVNAQAYASGPINDRLGVGFTIGTGKRDGFTTNTVTGNDVDYRDATYGKGQLLWTPSDWELRLLVTGERARDGDYALEDLSALRQNPFQLARDFEGHTHRDIFATTVQTRRDSRSLSFSTTTGFVKWKTDDLTDLDYSTLSLITRRNKEESFQFTQDVRFGSAPGSPLQMGSAGALRWQAGVFFFTQNYDQEAVNTFMPFVLDPNLGSPANQFSPIAALDEYGVGVYGQGIASFTDKFDLTFGARVDHEKKDADLQTFFDQPGAPSSSVVAEESYTNVSPHVAASYKFNSSAMVYSSVGRGYKAGDFNPVAPTGSEAYGEEYALHVEGGVKTLLADGKLSANASVFYIDWTDLQLNVANPQVPGQFYISNVGSAQSKGFELEVNARPFSRIDLFAALGFTHARFGDETFVGPINVTDNKLPSTPEHTFSFGGQFSQNVGAALSAYGRAEVWFNGGFEYDESNAVRQESYSLANFRGGVRARHFFVEGWLKNAFDTVYIPIAFAYSPVFAPLSGYIGEMGAPRRYGVTLGANF